jgi:plasmid maintenance system antidote protein VapI
VDLGLQAFRTWRVPVGTDASWFLYYPARAVLLTWRIVSFTMWSMQAMAHRQTEVFRANLAAICAVHGRIQEVADAAGLSRVHVSKIINGHSVPTIDVAARLAEAAGFSLSEMLAKKSGKKLAAAG